MRKNKKKKGPKEKKICKVEGEYFKIPLTTKTIINNKVIMVTTYPAILVLYNKDPDEKKEIVNNTMLVIKKA